MVGLRTSNLVLHIDFGIDVEYETDIAVLYPSYALDEISSIMVRRDRSFSVASSCLKIQISYYA